MATHRIFCYNPTGATISGTEQVGSIAAATGVVSIDPTKQWWNGPDEDVRYIVAYSSLNSERSNGPERVLATNYPCNLGFIGSSAKTDESFLNLAKTISGSSSLASASAAKTWLNTNGYWTSWIAPSFTGLLDTYSGAAAAYSAARRLSSTYTGALIRVRRSSDNTEQDIGYNGSNVLDEAALTSFVGSGNNGFVTTWYDQSGNSKNTTQATAINQPRIVNAGSIDLVNTKPAILGDGVNDTLINSTLSLTNPSSIFTVVDKVGTSGNFGLYTFSGLSGAFTLLSTGYHFYQNGPSFSPNYLNNNQSLLVAKTATTGTNWELYGNNTTVTNAGENIGTAIGGIVSLFDRNGTQGRSNMYMQEFIVWNSDQMTNRAGIQTNINTFYSIY
jgi:hypothetical protein